MVLALQWQSMPFLEHIVCMIYIYFFIFLSSLVSHCPQAALFWTTCIHTQPGNHLISMSVSEALQVFISSCTPAPHANAPICQCMSVQAAVRLSCVYPPPAITREPDVQTAHMSAWHHRWLRLLFALQPEAAQTHTKKPLLIEGIRN